MAPSKRPAGQAAATGAEDSSSSARPHNGTKTSSSTTTGGKKGTNGGTAGGAAAQASTTASGPQADEVAAHNSASAWQTTPLPDLLAYRFAHRLPVATPYASPLHAAVLGNRGIGRRSPTAVSRALARRARKQGHRTQNGEGSGASSGGTGAAGKSKAGDAVQRDTPLAIAGGEGRKKDRDADTGTDTAGLKGGKEELVAAVRRHFNAMPAEETAVLARMLYRVGTKDRAFRLRLFPKDVIPHAKVGGSNNT